jgi:hypothetical protein
MSDFLSEVQSDELVGCEEYHEWLELRRVEAIERMEQEFHNLDDPATWDLWPAWN